MVQGLDDLLQPCGPVWHSAVTQPDGQKQQSGAADKHVRVLHSPNSRIPTGLLTVESRTIESSERCDAHNALGRALGRVL